MTTHSINLHYITLQLPRERDNATNNARCTQARKVTHGLDGQHQYVDRTLRGRVSQNERGQGQMEKVRPWYGQPSDRGWLKNRTEQIAVETQGPWTKRHGSYYVTVVGGSRHPLAMTERWTFFQRVSVVVQCLARERFFYDDAFYKFTFTFVITITIIIIRQNADGKLSKLSATHGSRWQTFQFQIHHDGLHQSESTVRQSHTQRSEPRVTDNTSQCSPALQVLKFPVAKDNLSNSYTQSASTLYKCQLLTLTFILA